MLRLDLRGITKSLPIPVLPIPVLISFMLPAAANQTLLRLYWGEDITKRHPVPNGRLQFRARAGNHITVGNHTTAGNRIRAGSPFLSLPFSLTALWRKLSCVPIERLAGPAASTFLMLSGSKNMISPQP